VNRADGDASHLRQAVERLDRGWVGISQLGAEPRIERVLEAERVKRQMMDDGWREEAP